MTTNIYRAGFKEGTTDMIVLGAPKYIEPTDFTAAFAFVKSRNV
jgi:hypothetical protein